MNESRRIRREKKTIDAMIGMYCRAHHGASRCCAECGGLLSYAHRKIDACVFHSGKPACNACRVHCYSRTMREDIRRVMRFSGPRMLLAHPLLSALHVLDGLRGSGLTRP